MLLAALQNATKRFGAQTVLRDVSVQISSGRKVGLIGPNGSGKTTILRLLTGRDEPSDGNAFVSRGVRVGYVPQNVEFAEDATVMEHLLRDHARLTAELRAQEQRLAEAGTDELDAAMRAYQRARDAYDHVEGDRYGQKAEAMLDALGLAGRADQQIGSLSGGEKNVLALTEALLAEPDLLLLDEPGNHLDYMGIAWLEDFLGRYKGAVVIVSHNRYLLDRVVDGILHLEGATLTPYEGNYSAYRASRLRQLIAQQADYVANQKRLAQLEALVQRFADIARNSSDPKWGKRLRARRTQLEREKAQAVERPTLGPSGINPNFATEATKANIALQLRGYSRGFGDLALFRDVELEVACGERVALVGPNGCGKTTLLRDVIEQGSWEHPHIRVGPSQSVGYSAQMQEVLKGDRTVMEELLSTGAIGRRDAFGVLGRFLFTGDDIDKCVADLSGGERNRLQLAKITVQKPNFLILDEPTNHMDILAREAIEEALADFEGTLLLVSHDRYFLDKIVTRVVEVRDRKLVSFPGGFTEFWMRRRQEMVRTGGRVQTRRSGREKRKGRAEQSASAEELERRIADAEREKVELERRIASAFGDNDRRAGRRVSRELDRLQERIDALYEEWMNATS
jgi:ATP-binding cassette subfamily F protein 3